MKLPRRFGAVGLGLSAFVWASVLFASLLPAQGKIAIKAGRVVTGSGADLTDGVILIDRGRIAGIGSGLEVPEGYRVVDHGGGVVAPGFVDVYSVAGAPNDLSEKAEPVDRLARALDAVDLEHRDFGLLAVDGVTAVSVLPDHGNLMSGVGCVLSTGPDTDRVVRGEGALKFALDRSALSGNRIPASYGDALSLLRSTLERAEAGGDVESLNLFAAGKRPGVIWVNEEQAIRDAAALRKKYGLSLALLGASGVQKAMDAVANADVALALPVFDLAAEKRVARLPGLLAEAGVRVAFYAETPRRSAASLRLSAVVAAANGLDRRAAIAAITSVPAEIAGVADRLGALAVGLRADFVVLDGDVLDAGARVTETWVGGRRVHVHRPVAMEESKR